MAQNIKVAVRARPLNQREIDMDCGVVISMQDRTATLLVSQAPKHFTYDFVYSSIDPGDASCACQRDIYQEIGATILSNAIDGFNGTLFAYGQTGSGKSHTMMGPPEDYGIIPLMIMDLFTTKAKIEEDDNKELQIWVSYLEIYKERITDLFGAVDKQQEVKIMEHPKLGVYTKGVEEVPCETKEAVIANLEYGLQRRSIGATNMNQTSSRSHAVFCIKTTTLDGPKPEKKGGSGSVQDGRKALSAKINLIDLAGSERASKTGAEGERLKEGSAINMSLSALGMVIKALTEKRDLKVPFRASKLTFLLKDSLAGNARTYMMAAVSPASDNMDETLSTLRFASSVKTIETVAVQNKDKKDRLIEDLQGEMKLLKAQLALGGIDSEEALEQLRERERLVQEESRKDFQEQLEVAKELRRAREQALEENGLSQHHITQAFGIDSTTPYLVNMAFDPMLAGCLIYLIKESEPTRLGAHKDNSIILDGIGIPDFLCCIKNLPGTGVKIKRLSDKGRVGVNGRLLKENEELQLHNGDQVYLGRSTALKLVCPDVDGQAPLNKNDLLLEGDMELAMLEHSPSWASLEMFIDPVLRQMSPAAASAFVADVKRACQLSDEANELTSEYRKDLPLQFEVDLTSSMPPCLVIRVLTCPQGRDCMDEEAWRTKYVWHLSQLEERVDRMRDYSREVKLDAKVTLEWLEDPWVEAEPMEIVQRLRDLQQVADEADRAMLQQLTMGGSGVSNGRSIVSIVFWFWKSLVTAGKKRRDPSKTGTGPGRPALVRSGTTLNRMRMTVVPSRRGPPSPPGRRGPGDPAGAAPGAPGAPEAPEAPDALGPGAWAPGRCWLWRRSYWGVARGTFILGSGLLARGVGDLGSQVLGLMAPREGLLGAGAAAPLLLGRRAARGAAPALHPGPRRRPGRQPRTRLGAAPAVWLAAAAALGPTLLGFWKREYGVSYGYGGAMALIAALALFKHGAQPLTTLAAAHACIHLLYGVRLSIFLLWRELSIPRFREFRERVENRAPSNRLSRAPFIISCSLLYLWMSAPVLLTAGAPEIGPAAARAAAWAGVAAAVLGLLLAAVGDTQKSAVKARSGKDTLVTTGVFKYLRHPNYTGELLLWTSSTFVGVVSVAAHFTWPRLGGVAASLLGLLGIGFVLARAAANLEKRQQETYGSEPAYQEWLQSSWAGITLAKASKTPEQEQAAAA